MRFQNGATRVPLIDPARGRQFTDFRAAGAPVMTIWSWGAAIYATIGVLMFWLSQHIWRDPVTAYRIAVLWPLAVGSVALWLLLSLCINSRERIN
jgi:hypothetical protein